MPRCTKCRKRSIFLSVDSNGICDKCSSAQKMASESQVEDNSDSVVSFDMDIGKFFDAVMNDFQNIVHEKKYIAGMPRFVPEVYNAGNKFVYSWLCDKELATACETSIQMFHNIAIHAMFGGAFFAYSWENYPELFDYDYVYAIYRISDVSILGPSHIPYARNEMINLASELFNRMLSLLANMNFTTMDKFYENIRIGLWAIFCIGAGIQFENIQK